MELNRENILDKTNYGLNIYAHVLRQYYPGKTVLSLSGRDCLPSKNPFNGDKPTLIVRIIDNCAVHHDTELIDFKGDAFDFAALHFKDQEDKLFEKLSEALYLRIVEPLRNTRVHSIPESISKPEPPKKLLPLFSYFKAPVTNTIPNRNLSIVDTYNLIIGDIYKDRTIALRNLTDKQESRKFKAANFDYVTFSGTFSERSDKALRKHSRLICIDFDHIPDLLELKNRLLQDEYFETELLFTSPSGDGLKWIIAIDLAKASHLDFFKSIATYILQTYHVKVDQSGKDVSRACFLPHDAEVYINPKYL